MQLGEDDGGLEEPPAVQGPPGPVRAGLGPVPHHHVVVELGVAGAEVEVVEGRCHHAGHLFLYCSLGTRADDSRSDLPGCMYYACMTNVQVRDVPEDVHATLVRRAEKAGQSLQQFLKAQLALIAATPTIDEILDRTEHRPTGRLSAKDAIAAIDEERARR